MTTETSKAGGVHTCSYACERPECIRAQRDELASRMTAETSNARGFAVGERVRSTFVSAENKEFIRQGDTGTVKHIDSDGDLWVKWDNPADSDQQDCGWCINADHCERIAPPPAAARGDVRGLVGRWLAEADRAEANADRAERRGHSGEADAMRQAAQDARGYAAELEAALSQQPEARGVVDELLVNIRRSCDRARNSLPLIPTNSGILASLDHIENLAQEARAALTGERNGCRRE